MPQPEPDPRAAARGVFGKQADRYARHRPRYPARLFEYLAGLCRWHGLAWDCATGSGQAAVSLAEHFARVVATDASEQQLARATRHPKISYRAALAHQSGLPDSSADLVTVATALHWLDLDPFYAEVRRVARPAGVFAAWSYFDARIAPEVDSILVRYRREVLGAYWAFDVELVAGRYRDLPFPFDEIPAPEQFVARARWSLADLLGFLESWSATQRYRERTGSDPREIIRGELETAWGPQEKVREVEWPLFMRVGRVNTSRGAE